MSETERRKNAAHAKAVGFNQQKLAKPRRDERMTLKDVY